MSDPGSEKERGFTVVDRRGSATSEEPAPPTQPSEPAAAAPPELPGFDFSMLIQSFALTALHHLGMVPPESGATREVNLPLARQNIEILDLLEKKTRGNLEPAEAKLLTTLLYEVRMHFVEASKNQE